MAKLSEKQADLFRGKNWATVVTLREDGSPHATPVWIDTDGENAIVFVDSEPSHALRKRAVLRSGEIAPVRDDALGVAEAMYDPDLVVAYAATEAELESARAVIGVVARRFGGPPLYARVDQLHDSDGAPVVLELEAIEPSLYLDLAPGSAERLADAIIARAQRGR